MAGVTFNTPEMLERVRAGARRGVLAATEEVRNEALRLVLETPKTGRIYRRRGVIHQASAPGEAPASDTGRLVGSLRTEYRDDGLTGAVIASTEYASHLEYGTARMAPRPFMRPALAALRQAIVVTITRAMSSALAGSGG